MGSAVVQYDGVLRNGVSGASIFGTLYMGVGFDGTVGKTRILLLDRSSTVSAALNGSSVAEQFTLDSTAAEQGRGLLATVPVGAGAVQKIGNHNSISTSATGLALGGSFAASVSATQTGANIVGGQGSATITALGDATATGIQGVVVNNGTAVTSFSTLSKIACTLVSGGTVKNSAFLYAAKGSGAPINATHGICVDGASCDTSTFAVTSGTTPTILWGTNAGGKQLVGGANLASPGAGGGPFAGAAAANITISLTGLTTAAQNLSAAIVVNTTAVTAASRISADVISYAYGAAGLMAAGWPAVSLGAIVAGTSFSFQIANLGTGALSGAIGIAFKIEN